MSLCSSRRARLAALAAGLALSALFWGCGRTPPEAFWEPDRADTLAIDSLVRANKAFFRTALAELALASMDTALPGSTAVILAKEMRSNPYKQRFRANAMEHWVSDPDYPLDYKFIATLDTSKLETTCTVTFMETIPGRLRLNVFRYSRFIRQDTFFPNPSETLVLNRYDTVFTDTTGYVIEKFAAATEQDTMLGNATGGVVLKKQGGQWKIWKLSGGHRYWAPGPDDAPYFFDAVLFNGARADTIYLRPDTLRFGIQRFYDPDSQLLTYRRGDSIRLNRLRTNNGDCATYLYLNGRRYPGNAWIKLDSTVPLGINRLHIEHIPASVFWEVSGKYVAAGWIVPFKVTE